MWAGAFWRPGANTAAGRKLVLREPSPRTRRRDEEKGVLVIEKAVFLLSLSCPKVSEAMFGPMGVGGRVSHADREVWGQTCPWETLRGGFRPCPDPLTPFAMWLLGVGLSGKNLAGLWSRFSVDFFPAGLA